MILNSELTSFNDTLYYNGSWNFSNTSFNSSMNDGTSLNVSTDPTHECGYKLSVIDIINVWLFGIGLALNLIQICVVVANRKLRESTYTTISCLAVADFAFLFFSLATVLIVSPIADKETFLIYPDCDRVLGIGKIAKWNEALDVVTSGSYTSSSLHMILLSLVRYAVLVHPFVSKAHLTNHVVIMSSAGIWLVSISLNLMKLLSHSQRSYVSEIILWLINYPLVVFFIVVVHFFKIKGLKRLRMSKKRSPQTQMNIFVAATLIVFIIFPLPWNIVNFLGRYGDTVISREVWYFTGLVLTINNCINPVIFGFTSPACRKGLSSLLNHLPCLAPLLSRRRQMAATEASHMTNYTKVSRRSSSIAAVGDSCILSDVNNVNKDFHLAAMPLRSEL